MRTEEDILLELAWGVIANAGGGDWTRETKDWQIAAASWRDRWHLLIQKPYMTMVMPPQAPGVADLALMRGEAPTKADALPLGHEFRPYDSGFDQCGQRTTPWSVCGKTEAAHGRKPE